MKLKVEVLDHGSVELIEAWGSEERVVEAARMSTGKGFLGWGPVHAPECPRAKFGDEPCTCQPKPGDEKLLRYLYEHRHATPFEMAGLVLEVKAPLFVFREWHRHRTQSYNELSARYTPLPNENYLPNVENVLRRSAAAKEAKNKQAGSALGDNVLDLETALKDLHDLALFYVHGQRLYQQMLDHGWPKELARLPVPVARYSVMRASANLRNWLGFLTLRLAPAAQWEIRQYAAAVGGIVAQAFPRTWALFREEQDRA